MHASQRVVLDILRAEDIFLNDRGIMVCHKERLLSCVSLHVPNHVISALKLYIFQWLKKMLQYYLISSVKAAIPHQSSKMVTFLLNENPGLSLKRIGHQIIIQLLFDALFFL